MATKQKKRVIRVDFTGVGSGGLISEGYHEVEVIESEVKESDSGNEYLNLKVKCTENDPEAGRIFYHTCSFQPQALFNLRSVMQALGMDAPEAALDIDPDEFVGLRAGVEIRHEEYGGKTRAKAAMWMPLGEEEEEKPEEKPEPAKVTEKPALKAVKKKEEAEEEFKVGQTVNFNDDDGDEITGKIVSVEGNVASVKVGKETWEIEVSELRAA